MKNTKKCLHCKKDFSKKYSHSRKYWKTAKYCSIKCSRAVNNPRPAKPNKYEMVKWKGEPTMDLVVMYVESKGEKHQVLLDKKFWSKTEICNYRWSLSSGYPSRRVLVDGKYQTKPLHWFITPTPKKGFVVDHINGNKLDNTMNNLRELPHRLNIANQKVKNVHGAPGIRKTKSGNYSVRIRSQGVDYYLGSFKTKQEAIRKRIKAESKYWGMSFTDEKL